MIQRTSKILGLLLWVWAGVAGAQGLASRYVAGEHYKVIDPPVSAPGDGKIHVIEFFLYSCPHCYHLDPAVHDWRAQLGDDVSFTRVPVLFGHGGEGYARLYYTQKKLGVLQRLHAQVFDAIHQQGKSLDNEASARQFMVAHGVDADRFDRVYESDAVKQQVVEAARMMQAFGVRAVPSLGVAGHYWITGRMAGSNNAMFDVADYLIEQTRETRAGAQPAAADAAGH